MTFQEYKRCLIEWIEQQNFTIREFEKAGDHYYEIRLACYKSDIELSPVFNVVAIKFKEKEIFVWVSLETFLDEAAEFVEQWKFRHRIE